MRRPRIIRWILTLATASAGLLLAAAIIIRTDWFHDWLRRAIEDRARPVIAGELTVGSVTGDVLRGVTLHDVVLKQHGRIVLSIPAVSASYDALGLVRGDLAFHNLVIDHPTVAINGAADQWPIVSSVKPGQTPSREIELRGFTVIDGSARIDMPDQPTRQLGGIAMTGSLVLTDAGPDITIDDLSAQDEVTRVAIAHASTLAHIRGRTVTIDRFHVTTAGSDVSGGAVFGVPADSMDLTLHSPRLSLRELANYMTVAIDHSLVPSGDLRATGTLERLHVVAAMRSSAGNATADVIADLSRHIKVVTGSGTAQALNLEPIMMQREMRGHVTGRGTFELRMPGASLSQATIAFHVSASDAAAGLYRAQQLDSTGRFADHTLSGSVKASAFGAGWDLHGAWTFPAGASGRHQFTVAGNVSHANLPVIGRALEISELIDDRLAGDLTGSVDVHGSGRSLSDQDIDSHVILSDSTLNGVSISALDLTASSSDYALTADADATLGNVEGRALGLDERVVLNTSGAFHGHITLADRRAPITLDTVDASLTATLGSSTVQNVAIDSGTIDASLAAGIATIRTLQIAGPAGSVSATGTLAVGDAGSSNLTGTLDVVDLTTAGELLHQPMSGGAHVTGTIIGPVDRTVVDADVTARQFSLEPATALTSSGHVTATIPRWQLADATGTLTTKSAFVTIQGLDFEQVTASSSFNPNGFTVQSEFDRLGQSIAINASVTPHPDRREFTVRDLAIGTPNRLWTSASPDITVRDNGAEISIASADFTRGAERISVSGHMPTSKTGSPADLSLTLSNVQVADVNELALESHKLTGRLDGTARVTGTIDHFDLTSSAAITNGTVDAIAYERLGANVGYRDGNATVDLDLAQTATNRMTVKGSVPLDAAASGLNLDVRSSSVDARLLQPLIPDVTIAQGTIEGAAVITGSRESPSATGTLAVTNAAFTVPDSGINYRNLNAQVAFNGETAHLNSFSVEDDQKHTLKAEGGVQGWLAGARSMDITLTAAGFHLLHNSLGDAAADATLHVGGDLGHPEITGTVRASSARVDVSEWMNQFDVPSDETPSILDRTTWHLTLNLPDNVVVQGRPVTGTAADIVMGGVSATVGGSLTVDKAANGHPTIAGQIEIMRGTYQFQGRAFQITNGSDVRFQGRNPIDPDVSISAERQAGGANIEVQVTGTAHDPKVTLSSDPPLDQGDILALIVFNQPINSLVETQRNALANRAATMAAGTLTAPLADAVAQALDLDLFEIQASSDIGTGPAVAFGRQIGGNLFVRVQQGLSDSQSSQVSIEYQISKLLRLVTSIAQSAPQSLINKWAEQTGVDLIFVIRY